MKKRLRVLVRKEAAGVEAWAYVAIGLEEFIANQGRAKDDDWLSVVDGLGELLDHHDRVVRDEGVQPSLPAPPDIVTDWEEAMPIGERQIGTSRVADLRMGTIPTKGTPCPKCFATSGNDWSQCLGSCPMPISPHFNIGAKLLSATREQLIEEVLRLRGELAACQRAKR